MIEFKLNTAIFAELIRKGYSLDMMFLLKLLEETDEGYPLGDKIDNIIATMMRKGLISEDEMVTNEGRELLQFLSSTEEKPKIPRKKKLVIADVFESWWKAYPGTDSFDYKGRKFKGTRALRVKKEECKVKVEKILKSGEYTIEELIQALKLEMNQKQENSYKTGQNKMSYFQNSLTYLNQCTYEPYIELVRAGHKVEDETKMASGGAVEI